MVWQDYELINTKRVNSDRVGRDIFRHRLFLAMGGWSSVYLATLGSYSFLQYMRFYKGITYLPGQKVIALPSFVAGLLAGAVLFGNS